MDNIDGSLLKILRNKAFATVAIFEKNDFYACYGDDAFLVANEILLSEIGLKSLQIGSQKITYQILNSSQYARVVRDALLLLHYRVELYHAKDDCWELAAKGSLGCLGDFEDLIGNSIELNELSTIMAIAAYEDHSSTEYQITVAFCNTRNLRITVTEFPDTLHFSNLEKCISSLVPRECIILPSSLVTNIPSNAPKTCHDKLLATLKRASVDVVQYQIDENVGTDEMMDEVNSLKNDKFKEIHLTLLQVKCIHALINYLHLSGDPNYNKTFQFVNYKSAGYMYLSTATVKALELFTISYDEDGNIGQTGTLYEVLNKCRTPQGQRLLRDWIRRPLCDIRKIKERLDAVEALVSDCESRTTLYCDILRRIPDITSLTRKLIHKKAGLQATFLFDVLSNHLFSARLKAVDCYRLYQVLKLMKRFLEVMKTVSECDASLTSSVNDLCLEPLAIADLQFEKFVSLIDTTVDLSYYQETGTFRIKPEIDRDLNDMAEVIDCLKTKCESVFKKVCNEVPETVKLESNPQHGFYFRVTLKAEKSIRKLGFCILEINKGSGVRFTSSSLNALNEDYLQLQAQYDSAQTELVKSVVSTCAGYALALNQMSDVISVIDVLVALAVNAANSPFKYVRPELLDMGSKILQLENCRHPVMEAMPNARQFIPNDVLLGKNHIDEANCILLTGSNMGGKSTYLRSCALSVLMAQIGSFVPCDKARISVVDGIHTRIGSCDYQCKGVSTFMAEMFDCASILQSATSNSLVVIDELGRGTSTYEGFGLAWAIAEDIIDNIECFCIFATHFHELSHLHLFFPEKLRNMHVETEISADGDLILLYKIIEGVAQRSYGIHIAKRMGLPSEVVEEAEKILRKMRQNLTCVPPALRKKIIEAQNLKGEELRSYVKNVMKP